MPEVLAVQVGRLVLAAWAKPAPLEPDWAPLEMVNLGLLVLSVRRPCLP